MPQDLEDSVQAAVDLAPAPAFSARLDPNDACGSPTTIHSFPTAAARDAFIRGVETAAGSLDCECRPRALHSRTSPYGAVFQVRDRTLERQPSPRVFRFAVEAERDAFVAGVTASSGWLDPLVDQVPTQSRCRPR